MKNTALLFCFILLYMPVKGQVYFSQYYAPLDTFIKSQSLAIAGGSFYHRLERGNSTQAISKINSSGTLLYTREMNLAGGPLSYLSAIESDGNDLLLANAAAINGPVVAITKTDSSLLQYWTTIIDAGDITIPSALHRTGNEYYFSGYRDFPTGTGYTFDITLAKLNSSGTMLWGRSYGDNIYDYSNEASLTTADGGIIVIGNRVLSTASELFVTRFDGNGDQVWLKTIDITSFFNSFIAKSLVLLPDSSMMILGSPVNTNGNNDIMIVKMNVNGNLLWAKRYYNIGYEEVGAGIVYDSQGTIAVAGTFKNITTASDQGYFIMKTDTAGSVLSTTVLPFKHETSFSIRQHFFELPGSGYVLNGYLSELIGFPHNYHPAIVTTSYTGGLNCGTAPPAYPFSEIFIAATATTQSLLSVDASMTSSSDNLTTTSLPNLVQGSICNFTGITETDPISLQIYPNPSRGAISIELSLEHASRVKWKLTGIPGNTIAFADEKTLSPGNFSITPDLPQLTAGVYMLELIVDGKSYHEKIVVARE